MGLKKEHKSVHDNIEPLDVRENYPISAKIVINEISESVRVWKLSPVGIEIIYENNNLKDKSDYQILLGVENQRTTMNAVFINKYTDKGNTISCFRFVEPENDIDYVGDRRIKSRWNCNEQFFPTGIAQSPAQYNDFIYFKIRDISLGGMQLTCSLRNKVIFKGLTLDAIINFPMVSQLHLKLKVNTVNLATVNGRDVLRLGVTYQDNDSKINEIIANYLAQFSSNATIKSLREEGFLPSSFSHVVDYRYVKTKSELKDTMELRYLTNKLAGQLIHGATVETMSDEFDARSRIVNGYVGDKVICSARIIYSEPNDIMELEKYCKKETGLPNRFEIAEIMKLCIHPDYTGSDLLLDFFRHMALVCIQSKRRYVVLSCKKELIKIYDLVGFKEIGVTYIHPKVNVECFHILIADTHKIGKCEGISPVYWNLVWGDFCNYLIENGLVNYTPAELLRIKIVKLFRPLAELCKSLSRKKKIKKLVNSKKLKVKKAS